MPERLESEAIARMLDDLSRADLGDPRRVARAQSVVERLATNPNASLPAAMVADAELEGAYRLFGNDSVSFERVFDSHALGTAERASSSRLVLAIHDTTQCMFRHADPREVGYLNTGKPGFSLHLTLLVDIDQWRRPIGLTHAEVIPRNKPPRARGTKHRTPSIATAKKADSEFLRWHRGIDITQARLAGSSTAVIHIADRESDSYALMASCLRDRQRFIFRARTNRNTVRDGETIAIRDLIDGADVALEREVPLSRRLGKAMPKSRRTNPPRESRTARLCFSHTKATFRRPRIADTALPATFDINTLHVFETDAPEVRSPSIGCSTPPNHS